MYKEMHKGTYIRFSSVSLLLAYRTGVICVFQDKREASRSPRACLRSLLFAFLSALTFWFQFAIRFGFFWAIPRGSLGSSRFLVFMVYITRGCYEVYSPLALYNTRLQGQIGFQNGDRPAAILKTEKTLGARLNK